MNSRIAALFLAAVAVWAQPAGRSGPPPAPVRSPEVAADGRVTFRLRAPNAKEVFVTGEAGRHAMVKDESGVWSFTAEPMQADLYTYSFSIDGATVQDPSNAARKTAFIGGGQSVLHVPGAVSWTPADVPRGAIAHHFYKSAIVGDNRDFYVYTPPNYDAQRKEPYPVLYLLHGLGDDANGWLSIGAANVILDNLIAQGKAKPMIMVNTLGYGAPEITSAGRGGGFNALLEKNGADFTRTLLEEVMPQVEKSYRASKDRNQRAIAGLSMGGAESLLTALNHLDRFAWVASFSGAFVMWPGVGTGGGGRRGPPEAGTPPPVPPAAAPTAAFQKTFPALDAKANSQLRLLWIACGTSDGLNGINRQFKAWLKEKGVQFTDIETPGAHTWSVWRHNLTEVAPLLFQVKETRR